MNKFYASFIGAGNMGGIIAQAVIRKIGHDSVSICCSTSDSTKKKANELGCIPSTLESVCDAKYIFLGIKPQIAQTVLPQGACFLKNNDQSIVVSMLAGVTVDRIKELCGTERVIRIMPNTPSSVGEGVTLVCASNEVTSSEVKEFCDLISLTGKTDIIPEKLFDAATALSGCGPAYVYIFLEALADGAVKCGLPRVMAEEYAARTVIGAAKLALSSDKHTGELKDAVCSPGGSTIEGVSKLEDGAFRSSVMNAVVAAYEKSKELGK